MLRNRPAVATTLIGAIASLLIVTAAPVSAADTANPEICPPHVSSPPQRPAATGPGADLVLTFAKAAGSRFGGQAFSFVIAQLGYGDPTPALLRGISEQLSQVNAKLDRLEESVEELKRLVGEGQLTQLMLAFNPVRENVDSINDNGMQEVALAADNLATVLSSPATPEQIQEATDCLHQKQQEYERLLDTRGADTNVGVISSLMSSSAGETTLVTAFGRLLLHKRYLSHQHSRALRAFYDYLEQYQALAAIQRAEWQVATGKSRDRIETDNVAFYNEAGSRVSPPGLIQLQRAVLPDVIPEGVVIDMGTVSDTTLGKTMLFPVGNFHGGPDVMVWRDPDPQGYWTAEAQPLWRARQFVGPAPSGLRDWRIIRPAEWDSLMAAKPAEQTGSAYLNATFELTDGGRFRRPFDGGSFVWIDAPATRHKVAAARLRCCDWFFPVRWGLIVGRTGSMAWSGPARGPRPYDLPRSWEALPRAVEPTKQLILDRYDKAPGSLIVTRTTDVSYMALKPQPPSS